MYETSQTKTKKVMTKNLRWMQKPINFLKGD